MERFKPWKELVLALRSIADAINGGNDSGQEGEDKIDNTIYMYHNSGGDFRILIDKNFDVSKLSFDTNNPKSLQNINLLGDVFNQEGIDTLNRIIDVANANDTSEISSWQYGIGMFFKRDERKGQLGQSFFITKKDGKIKLQSDLFGSKHFETTERFSADDEIKTEEEH